MKLEELVTTCLHNFYERRIQGLERLDLKKFLSRKDPYLLKAKGIQKASEIVEEALISYIMASDETIFGDAFWDSIAIAVSGGERVNLPGIDFVVNKEDRVIAVQMKAGPQIYNSEQVRRQSEAFEQAKRHLYQLNKLYDPILGHGYGRLNRGPTNRRKYRDLAGQAFWEELTGDPDFYLKLIRLIKSDEVVPFREKFKAEWDKAVNRFTGEFIREFCLPDGSIDWDKLVRFVSEKRR